MNTWLIAIVICWHGCILKDIDANQKFMSIQYKMKISCLSATPKLIDKNVYKIKLYVSECRPNGSY